MLCTIRDLHFANHIGNVWIKQELDVEDEMCFELDVNDEHGDDHASAGETEEAALCNGQL